MFHRRNHKSSATADPGLVPAGSSAQHAARPTLLPIRSPVTYNLPFGDPAGVPFVAADDDSHLCPFDAAASFFVLYHAKGTRAPGVYVWSLARKEWDRVADLDELPVGEWCAVSDGDGFPLPLRLCRGRAGSVTAVWSREVI